MKIHRTFAVVEDSLYAVLFEHEQDHELERLFNLWNDAEYLEEFFQNNQSDLSDVFWGDFSLENAILKTRKDAQQLENKLIQIAHNGKTDRNETLSTFFRPLHKNTQSLENFEHSKAYGIKAYGKPSWLRIYAIRLDINLFLVSGGAIKLTKKMERPHLKLELEKLNIAAEYCKQHFDLTLGYFEID